MAASTVHRILQNIASILHSVPVPTLPALPALYAAAARTTMSTPSPTPTPTHTHTHTPIPTPAVHPRPSGGHGPGPGPGAPRDGTFDTATTIAISAVPFRRQRRNAVADVRHLLPAKRRGAVADVGSLLKACRGAHHAAVHSVASRHVALVRDRARSARQQAIDVQERREAQRHRQDQAGELRRVRHADLPDAAFHPLFAARWRQGSST